MQDWPQPLLASVGWLCCALGKVGNSLRSMWNRLISKPAPLHSGRIRLIKIACCAMHHSFFHSQQFTRISKLTPLYAFLYKGVQALEEIKNHLKGWSPGWGNLNLNQQHALSFPFFLLFWKCSSVSLLFRQMSENKGHAQREHQLIPPVHRPTSCGSQGQAEELAQHLQQGHEEK